MLEMATQGRTQHERTPDPRGTAKKLNWGKMPMRPRTGGAVDVVNESEIKPEEK